jgi:hypothetical protein
MCTTWLPSRGRRRASSSIYEAAGGDPSHSRRWQANMSLGGDQELLVALRNRAGEAWGCLGLYREPGEDHFNRDEIGFLRAAAPVVGEGVRRALLIGEARDPDRPDAPGLLVLTEDLEIESATPGTERWLDDLQEGGTAGGCRCGRVGGQAGAAQRGGARRTRRGRARAGAHRLGTWVVLHGASLVGGGANRIAVIVEPAHPPESRPC